MKPRFLHRATIFSMVFSVFFIIVSFLLFSGSKRKKTPQADCRLRASKVYPRSHLNSQLAAAHFVARNGATRRRISSPLLKGAFSPIRQRLAPTAFSLKSGDWGILFPVNAVFIFYWKMCGMSRVWKSRPFYLLD